MDRRRFKEPTEYSRLPKEYQEVEYLESTGTQYIDTGVRWEAPDFDNGLNGVDITFITDDSSRQVCLTGSENAGINWNFIIGFRNSRYAFYHQPMCTNYSPEAIAFNVENNIKYFVENKKFYLQINDSVKYNWVTQSSNIYNSKTYALFADNTTNLGYNQQCRAKILRCKMYKAGKLVRYYVPSVNKDTNMPGLYDIINNVFYTNIGRGEFIIGAEVKPDCDAPGELGPDNPMKAKFIGYKKVDDTALDNIKEVDRLWDYKRGCYNTDTGEFIWYVDDGLVFQLDSKIGLSNTEWKELTGWSRKQGYIDKDIVFKHKNVLDITNGASYNRGDVSFTDWSADVFLPTFDRENWTVEACFVRRSTTTGCSILWGGHRTNQYVQQLTILNYTGTNSIQYGSKRDATESERISCTAYPLSLNTIHKVGFIGATPVLNGVVVPNSRDPNSGFPTNGQPACIGSRDKECVDFPSDMILYGIRIYNRKLSVDEVLHNQRIDSIRFRLE